MIETQPMVFMIGEPQINTEQMLAYLREVGGEEWWERVGAKVALQEVPDAEGIIEFMGRLCYRSWSVGLNANVTKIREDREEYLQNILKQAHGSVLEHANFVFALHDVSRVLTAELNRHRAGVAISEQSLRYVRLDENIRFRSPELVLSPETVKMGRELVEHIEATIGNMYVMEGIDDEKTFFEKKTITSAIRRYAPLGMSTEEGWSANIRAIRHVISMRSAAGAEEEIRVFADQLFKLMGGACPALFGDYREDRFGVADGAPPVHRTDYAKV